MCPLHRAVYVHRVLICACGCGCAVQVVLISSTLDRRRDAVSIDRARESAVRCALSAVIVTVYPGVVVIMSSRIWCLLSQFSIDD